MILEASNGHEKLLQQQHPKIRSTINESVEFAFVSHHLKTSCRKNEENKLQVVSPAFHLETYFVLTCCDRISSRLDYKISLPTCHITKIKLG